MMLPSRGLGGKVVQFLISIWSPIDPSAAVSAQSSASTQPCRFIPGDTNWPSATDWDALNKTVGGRLIATVPLASICHGQDPDEVACEQLRHEWTDMMMHSATAFSSMAPYWQNPLCDPFHPSSTSCTLGHDVAYSINVSSASDIVAGIKFAREKNIRLAIRNTGHDFLGKSAGFGSLGIWVHHLRETSYIPSYSSPAYTGPAMKLGAGVRAFEATEAASANGVRVLSGYCPSVGIVGGFLQGGGSGPLSSTYGMAADQTLEFEVVLASGELVTATPTLNRDLYWALSGGGGGTYGVVVSATVRVFDDGVVGGAALSFSRAHVSTDIVYELLEDLFKLVPKLTDSGVQFQFTVTRDLFLLHPFTAPGCSVEQVTALLRPFVSRLEEKGIPYSYQVTSKPDYKTHFETYLGPTPGGIYRAEAMVGSRFVPRKLIPAGLNKLINATRTMTEGTSAFINFIAANLTKTPSKRPIADNAVLPQWRDAALEAMVVFPWDFQLTPDVMRTKYAEFTDSTMPMLRDALPTDAGTYLNEADLGTTAWKEDFYGANYDTLRRIKHIYDSTDLFYGHTAVGSDAWVEADDGRLCKTHLASSGPEDLYEEQRLEKTEL